MESFNGEEAKATVMTTRAKVKSAMERRRESAQALFRMKDSIQPLLLSLPPDVEKVRAEHSRWLQEYETYLIHHGECLSLVTDEQKPTVHAELQPELSNLQDFKTTMDQWLVYHTSVVDRGGTRSVRSHTFHSSGSRMSSTLSIARAMEHQKTAELLARTRALQEKGKLEEERLQFEARKKEE